MRWIVPIIHNPDLYFEERGFVRFAAQCRGSVALKARFSECSADSQRDHIYSDSASGMHFSRRGANVQVKCAKITLLQVDVHTAVDSPAPSLRLSF